MAKITKHYTLPNGLLQMYEELPTSRSAGIALAVIEARRDPTKLSKALTKRIGHKFNKAAVEPLDAVPYLDDEETTRVTVLIDEKIIEKLAQLSKMSKLPVEHVMRLSMEAYIHKL